MGNAGTDDADETRRDTRPNEPEGEPSAADTGRGTEPDDGEADASDADPSHPTGEPRADSAPEWPLTKENRIVEAATPPPTGAATRPEWGARDEAASRSADDHDAATEPPQRFDDAGGQAGSTGAAEDPHPTTDPADRPEPDRGTDDPHLAADPVHRAGPVRDQGTGDDQPRHGRRAGPVRDFADETTVLPVASHTAGPTETTVLPAVTAGHARVPGEAEPPSGFLVAQGLSAMGSEGPIFTSVSLAAELGEVVTVVGEAGTGRTALLLALAGRFTCQAGSVAVDGDSRPARVRASVAIAWAPPAIVFDENHTVAAVVTESALVGKTAESQVRRCCDELRLDLDTGAAFGQLPRVEQTLLAMASAWAAGTPVVAVDDLDSGVDDAGTDRLWRAARRVADDQRLVLVTAVRAGDTSDRTVHPRPLAPVAGARHGGFEPTPTVDDTEPR